jgi:2-phosphoglycolate phosphatase
MRRSAGDHGIKAVLFDLDGTLIDSAPDLGAAANVMRVHRGLPSLPLALYRAHAGSGARGMLQVAFGVSPDRSEYEELKREFLACYEACMYEQTRPFHQVQELLSGLESHGVSWGIVTNKMERLALPLVRSMPVFSNAGVIVGGDTTPFAKPHPAPLLHAAHRLGLLPGDCLYVGDDARDIAAGRAADMKTVAATYGYLGSGAVVANWGADAEAASPLDVLKWLALP